MKARKLLPWIIICFSVPIFIGTSEKTVNAQVCKAKNSQTALQYLRRLSLDLLGRAPTYDELWSVIKAGKVSDKMIDDMIQSPKLLEQLRAYHMDLLWSNIRDVRLSNVGWRLSGNGRNVPFYGSSQYRRRVYRGSKVSCLNEPARFDASGTILTKCKNITEVNGTKRQICQEGYVMIRPYWDPSKAYKVCAFDAQTKRFSQIGTRTYDCSKQTTKTCGCGPALRHCLTSTVMTEINKSMTKQLQHFVENIIKENKPYTDVILGREMPINGHLSHWYQFQTHAGGNLVYATLKQNHKVPNIPYSEKNNWVSVSRGTRHSGILTMAGYLLKFQSNRSRANRFYNAFLCKHFQAPASGLPAADSDCHKEPNLTKRCGCKYCHVGVEPAAAYWGRWAEAGLAPLNSSDYPTYLKQCDTREKEGKRAINNSMCRRLYFLGNKSDDKDSRVQAENDFTGQLRAYIFADKTIKDNIERGPRGIAQESVNSGIFASCATKNIWKWFVGKKPEKAQAQIISKLSKNFQKDKYKLLNLIKAIVKTDEYRLGRLLNR